MGKPIEEGCRAVIVGSNAGNNGIVVTVGKFIGTKPTFAWDDLWSIEESIIWSNGEALSLCRESMLKRIDDHDDKEELGSWEELKHIWNPDTVGA